MHRVGCNIFVLMRHWHWVWANVDLGVGIRATEIKASTECCDIVEFMGFPFCRMFYLFFESRNSNKDPIVIWLTGGPGCSSELAVFYENGPFGIADNMSLVWNQFGWDQVTVGAHCWLFFLRI